MIAGVNVFSWVAAGALSVGGSELTARAVRADGFVPRAWPRIGLGVVLSSAGAYALVAGTGSHPGPLVIGALITTGCIWLLVVLLRLFVTSSTFPFRPVTTVLYGLVAIGIVLVLPTASTWEWGRYVRDHVGEDTPAFGPLALEFVVQPTVGTAVVENESVCVLRLAERVFLGTETVVVRDVDAFIVEDCPVVARPFAQP